MVIQTFRSETDYSAARENGSPKFLVGEDALVMTRNCSRASAVNRNIIDIGAEAAQEPVAPLQCAALIMKPVVADGFGMSPVELGKLLGGEET